MFNCMQAPMSLFNSQNAALFDLTSIKEDEEEVVTASARILTSLSQRNDSTSATVLKRRALQASSSQVIVIRSQSHRSGESRMMIYSISTHFHWCFAVLQR